LNPSDVEITQDPTNSAYLVGEDAVLSCSVKKPEGAATSVRWYKVIGETSTALDTSLINFYDANPGTSRLTFSS
jgi:hypothetical protein